VFKRRLAAVVNSPPSVVNPHQFNRLATFSFSLGRHRSTATETPLWFILVHLEAVNMLGRSDGLLIA